MTQSELEHQIKTAADKMRRDDNTKTTYKYLEHLSWLLFLKVFEQVEDNAELSAAVDATTYTRVIDGDSRWSRWTRKDMTGDELISWVTDQLLPYLRTRGGNPASDKIAQLFQGVTTVMKSGYNLAEVIEVVDGMQFNSSDDYHTMSVIYETLLSEMGSDGDWSGEFYTPRPIIELMVELVNPELGERVYDPCAGSGGFLVATFEWMRRSVETPSQNVQLQARTLFGQEAGELPFLLGTMNMMLHGILAPNLIRKNTLEDDIRGFGSDRQYEVILTNPPFGGSENKQLQRNFPIRTSATEVLFLQHVMASMKSGARCGIVVPGGVLFDDDSAFRTIRKRLLEDFNLHTIVRLPEGSFPHTPHQRLNLMFFDKGGPTRGIWLYEHPVPEHRRHLKHPRYTKTHPLRFEEFQPILDWSDNREANDWAWYVDVKDLDPDTLDLDLRHPDRSEFVDVSSPDVVVTEARDFTDNMQAFLEELTSLSEDSATWDGVEFETKSLDALGVEVNPDSCNPQSAPDKDFTYIDLSRVDRGVIAVGDSIKGSKAPSRARRLVKDGDVLFATVRPYLRGHAVVPPELANMVASTGFAVLRCPKDLLPQYLLLTLLSPYVVKQCLEATKGAHYPALRKGQVKNLLIPVPGSRQLQEDIVDAVWSHIEALRSARSAISSQLMQLEDTLKDSEFSLLGSVFPEAESG